MRARGAYYLAFKHLQFGGFLYYFTSRFPWCDPNSQGLRCLHKQLLLILEPIKFFNHEFDVIHAFVLPDT